MATPNTQSLILTVLRKSSVQTVNSLIKNLIKGFDLSHSNNFPFYTSAWSCILFCLGTHLQSNQVKRTPQEAINEFIIQKLNPLLVVDFRLISALLHV